ncbi:hypothetical protein BDN70DRAFT_992742 [Pholiota conissans]|uniref:F-box domain-containing protein n=1 Tax=Pholiota conissans TaxID=109636 RepID=A0A9P6D1P2_9AGAR|nr:hypothetical protein BDN70DRAFT_992742 [Pholiota conissans]
MTSLLSSSPIGNIPYDILCEIFLYCMPHHPFHSAKSKSRSTPLLLCHVCSFWRSAALSCPSLWSHLQYTITMKRIKIKESGSSSMQWAFLRQDIDFLRWWKENQGTIAPFLSIDVCTVIYSREELQGRDYYVGEDTLDFVATYLNSAQYLRIDDSIYRENMPWIQPAFQNLHTLVFFYNPIVALNLLSSHSPKSLRFVSLQRGIIQSIQSIPHNFSALTHLSLHNVRISIESWYTLLRAVPKLEWGYFHIKEIYMYPTPTPTSITLSRLTSLTLSCNKASKIVALLKNLLIPVLHTLSLSSRSHSWQDERAIPRLTTILRRTPNITTLSLGETFLSLHSLVYDPTILAPEATPFWECTLHLAHLQLGLPFAHRNQIRGAEDRFSCFIRNVFRSDNTWLGLRHPSCPLHCVTIVDDQFDNIRDFATSETRRIAQAGLRVNVRIASESIERSASHKWMEWGSRA